MALLILIWSQILKIHEKQDSCHNDILFSIIKSNINNIKWLCTPIGLFVYNFKKIEPLWKLGNYDVMAAILDFFETKNSIKSLRTSICTYISYFVKIRPFLKVRILAWNTFYIWCHSRHFENRRIANLKWEDLQPKVNWTFWWKPHVSTIFGSGGVFVTKQIKMVAVASILDDLNWEKNVWSAIRVLVPLVKFCDDSNNAFSVKCVTDRQTDGQTKSDNNSSGFTSRTNQNREGVLHISKSLGIKNSREWMLYH